uniref:Uncharacterized protein n=1 Tax=Rhizophora mucronata TaxID=61149 RepID=A0A2P2MQH1_RHIMU
MMSNILSLKYLTAIPDQGNAPRSATR